jgi:transposase
MRLTEDQWNIIKPVIPEIARREDNRGRPPIEPKAVFEGILWILKTGARWKDLPGEYPSYQTCHRWFQEWVEAGVFQILMQTLAQDLKERGKIDVTQCFIDGTFSSAKKGDLVLGLQSGARVRKSWQLQTALVFLSPFAQRALLPTKLHL